MYLVMAPKGAEARAPDSRTGASALQRSSKLGSKLEEVTSSCKAPLTCDTRVNDAECCNELAWFYTEFVLQTPSICLARSSWWAVIGSLSSLSSFLGLLLRSWLSTEYVKGALLLLSSPPQFLTVKAPQLPSSRAPQSQKKLPCLLYVTS